MEDNLRILKVEYLSNQLLDYAKILYLRYLHNKTIFKNPENEDDLQ